MAKLCTITACPYPLSTEPGMKSSKWCYWHRLDRSTIEAQEVVRARRCQAGRTLAVPHSGERICLDCDWSIPAFYLDGPRCKACARRKRRLGDVERTYSFPPSFVGGLSALETLQDRRCGICGRRQQSKALAVDHDHGTGLVRGLLCQDCNHKFLGAARDSLHLLRRAIAYLEAPPTSGEWKP